MPPLSTRLKLVALLSPAILLFNLWALLISSFVETGGLGLAYLLVLCVAASIMAAYFIVLTIFAVANVLNH